MPNLLLTQKCVRSCPYCFAERYMSDSPGRQLAWDDYAYVLDFYERNEIRQVSLLGGEPMTHPDIADLMDFALQRGFQVRVFTSGITSDSQRRRVAAVWDKHKGDGGGRAPMNFIVNVNDPSDTPPPQRKSQEAFLEAAGPLASISFNLYRPDFDLGFAFDLIAKHKLMPTIRLGLTHPIAGAGTQAAFIGPSRYRDVAATLEQHLPRFDAAQVTPGFDCGFPICMFTDAQIGKLVKSKASFNWTCGPIVDIGPDLELWPCFPLTEVRAVSLYDFDTFDEVLKYFRTEVRARRRRAGAFPECDGCALKERQLCSGGCLSYAISEVPLEQENNRQHHLRLA